MLLTEGLEALPTYIAFCCFHSDLTDFLNVALYSFRKHCLTIFAFSVGLFGVKTYDYLCD